MEAIKIEGFVMYTFSPWKASSHSLFHSKVTPFFISFVKGRLLPDKLAMNRLMYADLPWCPFNSFRVAGLDISRIAFTYIRSAWMPFFATSGLRICLWLPRNNTSRDLFSIYVAKVLERPPSNLLDDSALFYSWLPNHLHSIQRFCVANLQNFHHGPLICSPCIFFVQTALLYNNIHQKGVRKEVCFSSLGFILIRL